jgi:hypothetical protein
LAYDYTCMGLVADRAEHGVAPYEEREVVAFRLLDRHHIGRSYLGDADGSDSHPTTKNGRTTLVLSVMPILPFYVDLAKELGIPLERISVEAEAIGTGYCETCSGYGLRVVIQY